MHDYGIYGNFGKNDRARLSGMYYGSKEALQNQDNLR